MTVETVYRSCPTCQACCGLVMEVDREEKKVLSIKGDEQDPRSKGYVCAKSQAFRYIYEDPERVRRPLKKVNGEFVEVSWEQAFDDVSKQLISIRDQYGKDSIGMYYGNPNAHNGHTMLYTMPLIHGFNTERFFTAGSMDQLPQNFVGDLLYGQGALVPIPDMARSDFFVCMGGNPLVSEGSFMGGVDIKSMMQGMRDRGGKIVVLDPRRTETAEFADQHLFIKPATDALLLLAWVNEIFTRNAVNLGHLSDCIDGLDTVRELAEKYTPELVANSTGVSADALRQLVSDFLSAESPVLYGRIGLCSQAFGSLSSWLIQVINILCGRLDAPGGLMFSRAATGQSETGGDVLEFPYNRWKSRVREFPEYMGMLPASCMGEELECEGDDKIRAFVTVAGNPVLSVPNGKRISDGFANLDFMVAFDIYINETTQHADYILPSTVQLEHSNHDFLFATMSQSNFVHYSPQVFEAAEDSRDQYQIILEVVARMNGSTAEQLDKSILKELVDQIVTGSDGAFSEEMIMEKSSAYTAGDRMLDIMLRVGPYGDYFGHNPDGLNLEVVKAAPQGIDLGSLQPQLPGLLRTKGQKINLAPAIICEDEPRLAASMTKIDSDKPLLMIGRRNIRDMNSWLHNINQYVRGKNRCTLMIHPEDAKARNLNHGDRVKIEARIRTHEVELCISDEMMPGVVSLPHGFGHVYTDTQQSVASDKIPGVSANDLVDDEVLDMPSGAGVANGVPVQVSAL